MTRIVLYPAAIGTECEHGVKFVDDCPDCEIHAYWLANSELLDSPAIRKEEE